MDKLTEMYTYMHLITDIETKSEVRADIQTNTLIGHTHYEYAYKTNTNTNMRMGHPYIHTN